MNRRTTWAAALALAIIAPLVSGQNEIVVGRRHRPTLRRRPGWEGGRVRVVS